MLVGILEGKLHTDRISERFAAFAEEHQEPELIGADDSRYFHFPSIEQLVREMGDTELVLECERILDEMPDALYILLPPV